jgi:basic membrane protein A
MVDVAPTTTLVSSRIDWSKYIFAAVDAVLNKKDIERSVGGHVHGNDVGAGFEEGWVQLLDLNNLVVADGTEAAVEKAKAKLRRNQITVFQGDYIGVNPDDPEDKIDLNSGYIENETASAPSFHYILQDVVTVVDEK